MLSTFTQALVKPFARINVFKILFSVCLVNTFQVYEAIIQTSVLSVVWFSRSVSDIGSWQSKTDVGQLILCINLQYLYVKWRINGNILKFWHYRQVGICKWNKSFLIRYQINIVNICPTKLRNVNRRSPLFRIPSYCSQT